MIEVIRCQSCGNVFAACYVKSTDLEWQKKAWEHAENGCKVEVIENKDLVWCQCDIPKTKTGDAIGSWVSVKDKFPTLIEGKDYSEVVEGYNKHNGVFFTSLSWVNDGDNSGYTWNMHESGYSIDEDPSEWMDEDDYPTHWRIITKPIGE